MFSDLLHQALLQSYLWMWMVWQVLAQVVRSAGSGPAGNRKTAPERGTCPLHLLVPKGTGTLEALELRKAMSVAFRQATNLPTGILYRDHMFDPPDLSQTGNRVRFSLGIDYEYQDILT